MPAKTIDAYLKTVTHPEQKAALQKLAQSIRKIVPTAQETVSYGLPAFSVNGKAFAAFAAAKKHCSFYPMSGSVITELSADLTKFQTSKGAIHFQPDKPIPAALLRKIIKTRLAEIAQKSN